MGHRPPAGHRRRRRAWNLRRADHCAARRPDCERQRSAGLGIRHRRLRERDAGPHARAVHPLGAVRLGDADLRGRRSWHERALLGLRQADDRRVPGCVDPPLRARAAVPRPLSRRDGDGVCRSHARSDSPTRPTAPPGAPSSSSPSARRCSPRRSPAPAPTPRVYLPRGPWIDLHTGQVYPGVRRSPARRR